MKKNLRSCIFLIIFTAAANILYAQYPSQNITMLSNFDDVTVPAEPVYAIRYNGIWGWNDGSGKEYACIGATNGVYIVEVTNPATPVQRDFIPGCVTNCIWRELKTYDHYLYMVSDDGGPNCLQIADLSYLPDSVHIVHQSNQILTRSHTIFIDGNKLYCGLPTGAAVGGGTVSMAVFSLANPVQPVLLRKLSDDYPSISAIHDMYVRNDTVYASASWDGLHIYKFNSNNTFSEINSVTSYPGSGYNHSSALTDDGHTLIVSDEVPAGLPLKAFDISDLQNIPTPVTFRSTPTSTATPHNPFMMYGHFCVVAYYQDGLQIFDVSNPANIVRTGYFDSNPTNCPTFPNPNYTGCWGAYTELPSGNIIVSDMQNGLFVLDAGIALGILHQVVSQNKIEVYPNPVKDFLQLNADFAKSENLLVEIYSAAGEKVLTEHRNLNAGQTHLSINLKKIASGAYTVKLTSNSFNSVNQILKMD